MKKRYHCQCSDFQANWEEIDKLKDINYCPYCGAILDLIYLLNENLSVRVIVEPE